jgi:SRSO17 transposase
MGLPKAEGGESRFAEYVEGIVSVIGHADRARPLWDYCTGLVLRVNARALNRWLP